MTYLLVGYLGYRVYVQRYGWRTFIAGMIFFGLLAFGLTAVTFLPGIEYLSLATRSGLGFDAKGNGFPFQDLAQFVFPGTVSLFSPLYVGIPALIFVIVAIWQKRPQYRFWLVVFLIGLVHSFGANSAFYHSVYNFVPGLRFFRGQERAAFLVANSLAILAGMGVTAFISWDNQQAKQRLLRWMLAGVIGIIGLTSLVFIGWLYSPQAISDYVGIFFFSTLISILSLFLIKLLLDNPNRYIYQTLVVALVVFELFSVNLDAESNYDPIPAHQQLSISAPPHVQAVLDDASPMPFRVDGFRALEDNFGSLYRVHDIRGISPLFLASSQQIIYRNYVDNPLAWELFAVKYVYSEREEFPFETEVLLSGKDHHGQFWLHKLQDPRPFAQLVVDTTVVDSDEFARALLDDPRFNPRESIILHQETTLDLPERVDEQSTVDISDYSPEAFTIEVDLPHDAILSVAHPDYPGWQASIDNKPAQILRAYGALSAIEVPPGEHTIRFVYDPLSYRIGAILSLVTWLGLGIVSVFLIIRRR